MKGIKILQQRMSIGLLSFVKDITKGFRIGIGIVLALTTAGIFAVAVTGTFNTFSSGSVMKSADINANFASLKTAIEGIPTEKAMRLVYETDVTSTADFVNITGLSGDTDLDYMIVTRFVNSNPNMDYYIQLNSDTNNANYGYRNTSHVSGTGIVSGTQNSQLGLFIGGHGSAGTNGVTFSRITLYAKSGTMRFALVEDGHFSTTSLWANRSGYSWWTNSAANITSMKIVSSVTNAIGAGSHIEVWARR